MITLGLAVTETNLARRQYRNDRAKTPGGVVQVSDVLVILGLIATHRFDDLEVVAATDVVLVDVLALAGGVEACRVDVLAGLVEQGDVRKTRGSTEGGCC